MANAIQTAEPDIVDRLLRETQEERKRVDASHPPTAMRMEFIRALSVDLDCQKIRAAHLDFDLIDAELAPHKDRIGKDLMQELHAAEFEK